MHNYSKWFIISVLFLCVRLINQIEMGKKSMRLYLMSLNHYSVTIPFLSFHSKFNSASCGGVANVIQIWSPELKENPFLPNSGVLTASLTQQNKSAIKLLKIFKSALTLNNKCRAKLKRQIENSLVGSSFKVTFSLESDIGRGEQPFADSTTLEFLWDSKLSSIITPFYLKIIPICYLLASFEMVIVLFWNILPEIWLIHLELNFTHTLMLTQY